MFLMYSEKDEIELLIEISIITMHHILLQKLIKQKAGLYLDLIITLQKNK